MRVLAWGDHVSTPTMTGNSSNSPMSVCTRSQAEQNGVEQESRVSAQNNTEFRQASASADRFVCESCPGHASHAARMPQLHSRAAVAVTVAVSHVSSSRAHTPLPMGRHLVFAAFCVCVVSVTASAGTFSVDWSYAAGQPQQSGNYDMEAVAGVVVVQYPTLTPTAGTHAVVFGLNPTTGQKVWEFNAGNPLYYGDGGLVVNTASQTVATLNTSYVHTLDPATGKLLWRAPVNFQAFAGFADGVFVAGTDAGSTRYNTLGYDATSGSLLYNQSTYSVSSVGYMASCKAGMIMNIFQGGPVLLDPHTGNYSQVQLNNQGWINLVAQDSLVLCSTPFTPTSTFIRQDVATGKQLWSVSVPAAHGVCNISSAGFSTVKQGAVNADETVAYFVMNDPSTVVAVNVADGSTAWAVSAEVDGATGSYGYPCVTSTYVAVFQLQPQSSGAANIIRITAYSVTDGSVLGSKYFENTLYPTTVPLCLDDGVLLFATGPSTFHKPDSVMKFVLQQA